MLTKANIMKAFVNIFKKSLTIGMVVILFLGLCITPVIGQSFESGFQNADGDTALLAIAKTSKANKKSDKMVMPVFDVTKKYKDINEYMAEALVFPEEVIETGHSGMMKVQFQIQTDGHIGNIHYLESPGQTFEKEVTKALMAAPQWTPASKNSTPVQTTYQLNINFSLL